MKNEVAYVLVGEERLKSEVLRVEGRRADLQVFEETGGITVGDRVELSGELLSAVLGPGLLGTVYDGLQNPLERLAQEDGFFLKRGRVMDPLELSEARWEFTPSCRVGARVRAGDCLGTVPERAVRHSDPGALRRVRRARGDLDRFRELHGGPGHRPGARPERARARPHDDAALAGPAPAAGAAVAAPVGAAPVSQTSL
jgi:hypothetical protein